MMGDPHEDDTLPPATSDAIDAACARFEDAWKAAVAGGPRPRLEDHLGEVAEAERSLLLRELILLELYYRVQAGETVRTEDYRLRFPALSLHWLQRKVRREQAAAASLPEGSSPASSPLPGEPVVPGYEVLGLLGRGGMGVVHKARQVRANRIVALKRILHAEHADEEQRLRFKTEAEAVARLQHPHIVQIFEVGEHAGQPFFSLEYCPGGSLNDQLDGTPWPPAKAAELAETLARAVQVAHEARVVHRDLKPANVLLTADGVPKITDFGLAKKLDEAGRTGSGALVGTPSYMPPEQAGGKSKEMGPACDVYSLGAILYELLTGRPPFKGAEWMDTVVQVLMDEPVPVRRLQPKVPRDLETICHKCLEKEPKKRYATALDLAEDLRRFREGAPVVARPVGVVGRAAKWARRRPAVAGLLALVVLVGALGLGGILWAYGEAVWQRNLARDEASRADVQAEEARQAAEAEKKARAAADLQTYRAQIGRAEAYLQAKDHAAADEVLQRIGLEHRGWEYGCLRRLTDGTPLTLRGHTGGVLSVSFSPEGMRLASAGGEWNKPGELKVWGAHSGAEILSLRGHTNIVTAVTYSRDGSRLASASWDNTVKIWDAKSGAEVLTLRGHTSAVNSVSYSPDGTRLASASWDPDREMGEVKIWDARSGAEILTLRGHNSPVRSICYSPDGTRLASVGEEFNKPGEIKVWDANSGAELLSLRGHTSAVNSVSYNPDGTRLASAAGDYGKPGEVKIWDANSGAEVRTLRGHNSPVRSICYSPAGTRLASSAGLEIKVWDANSGAELLSLRGHTNMVTAVTYSPDGTRLASASSIGPEFASGDNTIKVWDARSGAELLTMRGHTDAVESVSYSPDGTRLASASSDKTVKVWDARSGAELLTLRGVYGPVCYSPDGTRLASAVGDPGALQIPAEVKVWDARSGAEFLSLRGHNGQVTSVTWSPDGRRLASAGEELGESGEVKVWDANSGAELLSLRGHKRYVHSLSYSPDGSRLASASNDGTVKVWDAKSGAELATLRGHTNAVLSVSYSPDGTRMASASLDYTVKVWDTQSGTDVLTLRGHPQGVAAVSYSPDGSRLASASGDNTIKVWDARSGALLLTLRGHSWVRAVSYSPDGSRLASAWADNTVKVWDARAGAYDLWAEDLERHTMLGPAWHAEELAAARQLGHTFAAEFHRRWLAQGDNLRILAWNRLAAGEEKSCREILQQLHAQQGLVGSPSPILAAAAVGLAARPAVTACVGAVATATLLEQEQRRVAAVLLRAATLIADNGLPAAELVQLGQQGVRSHPQSWRSRELLGAALYRAGRDAEAVRELDEAVRLHGKGSLWANLFLALAHQHQGHVEQVQQLRQQTQDAAGWEEMVIQARLLGELDAPQKPASK
jgi:WD40 repeat protein/tRNA A-37 threonylcarbamoyl transferase component Bud32